MIEEIYIDGKRMDLEAGKVNVQLIYQSPIMMDFKSIVSNRTTQVTLPLTKSNLRAVGYTGTPVESDFPYVRHRVLYKRDGVQILSGFATLLSMKEKTMSLCFTWGNVEVFVSLFDTNLRDLPLGYTSYPTTDPRYMMFNIQYGGGRTGIGIDSRAILTAIEAKCGVSGLTPLSDYDAQRHYALALTERNGDTVTRELQSVHFVGISAVSPWNSSPLAGYTVMLKGPGSTDPHDYMDTDGIITLNGAQKVRINLKGQFRMSKRVSTDFAHDMMLLGYNNETQQFAYIDTFCQGVIESHISQTYTILYNFDKDQVYDVSAYTALVIVLFQDSLGGSGFQPTITDVLLTHNGIIPDPDEPEVVIYDSGILNTYPIALNLPDMSCGQFIKNMLWLSGRFAYSPDGKELRLVSFNALEAGKSDAPDWTGRMISRIPSERQTKLEGLAQKNLFRYAEADWYDNAAYQGELPCDDVNIDYETVYCESDFALLPENKIPAWVKDEYGEWTFSGSDMPAVLLLGDLDYAGSIVASSRYMPLQQWPNLLTKFYALYARIIRRPVVIKVKLKFTIFDLCNLDMTIPVYLKQTGRYYIIRTLTVKDGHEAEAELIQI